MHKLAVVAAAFALASGCASQDRLGLQPGCDSGDERACQEIVQTAPQRSFDRPSTQVPAMNLPPVGVHL
jgi:hypothetical protein